MNGWLAWAASVSLLTALIGLGIRWRINRDKKRPDK